MRRRGASDRTGDAEEAECHRADRDQHAGRERDDGDQPRRAVIVRCGIGRFLCALLVDFDQLRQVIARVGEFRRHLVDIHPAGFGLLFRP